jgi:UDPglucose--hexose-1-phosphate uridylyltransferase
MSEFRQDPVTGVWTLIVPGRAGRPKDFARRPDEAADPEHCPLCAGHEQMTPPTKYLGQVPGVGGWVTRVVDNKFPALENAPGDLGVDSIGAPFPYKGMTGFGAHEVIVETPRHGEGLADYSDEHAAAIVDTLVDRVRFWRDDGRIAHTLVFRNWGQKAGASLAHAHMQLAALPRIPDTIVRELGNSMTFADQQGGRCVMCAALKADDEGGRVVWDDENIVVHSPWAAPIPYALRLAPRRHAPSILDLTTEERASFGRAMVAIARGYKGLFGDPAFNLMLHIAPYRLAELGAFPYHWHVQFILRTSDQAGFEWGTGQYLNVIDPDEAAEELRQAIAQPVGAPPLETYR